MTAAGLPAWNSERPNSTAAATTRGWQGWPRAAPGGLRPGYVWGHAGRELRITSGRRAGGDDYSSKNTEVPAMTSGSPAAAPEPDLMRPVRPARKRASAKGARAAPAAASPARGKKTRSRAGAGRPRAEKATATPAGKSLDRAQRALDQAAKTEKQLRASLKKHSKAVSAARDDLDRRDRELEAMKTQLKTAKKSRKRAARELGTSAKPAAAKR